MLDFTPTFILDPDPDGTSPSRDAFTPAPDPELLDAYSDAVIRTPAEGVGRDSRRLGLRID